MLLSIAMGLTAMVMLTIVIIQYFNSNSIAVLYLFFGLLSVRLSWGDYRFYQNPRVCPNAWQTQHLSRMMGAFTAAFTAFLVAGMHWSTFSVWIIPTVLGTIYILYWTKKLTRTATNQQRAMPTDSASHTHK